MTDHFSQLSAVEFLYSEVRAGILRGEYKPGSVLRQEDIARKFQVSRVPLREAFSKLDAEGFLALRPRRGYAVISLNPDEIEEIFDLRMVIESHAGQIATVRRNESDVEAVNRIIATMEALDAAAADYFTRWCDLNREFHERLIKPCARERLLKLLMQLRDIVEPYIRLEMTMTGHSRDADVDHREIAAAFAAGNAALVGSLCASHCGRTAVRLLGAIKSGKMQADGADRRGVERAAGVRRSRKNG